VCWMLAAGPQLPEINMFAWRSMLRVNTAGVRRPHAMADGPEPEFKLRHRGNTASLHGESAAKRQAITELLFFASVGDLIRCKKICATWCIDVSEAPTKCPHKTPPQNAPTKCHAAALGGCRCRVTGVAGHCLQGARPWAASVGASRPAPPPRPAAPACPAAARRHRHLGL
jgi:hypothetical protein